jgi:hypothetical protein
MTKGLWLAALAGLLSVQESPFNGKDLTGWKIKGPEARNKWKVGKAVWDKEEPARLTVAAGEDLVNSAGKGVDLYTEATWGDAVIEVEVLVPRWSNSGVYVLGEYEVQVLDSFGKEKVGSGDMGGLTGAAAPRLNASKPAGEWQKFVIDYRAPKFDDKGMKITNMKFLRIELNGQVIHENVEMKGPTPGALTGKEAATGPILFQGDHGPVAYRGIKVTPVK